MSDQTDVDTGPFHVLDPGAEVGPTLSMTKAEVDEVVAKLSEVDPVKALKLLDKILALVRSVLL